MNYFEIAKQICVQPFAETKTMEDRMRSIDREIESSFEDDQTDLPGMEPDKFADYILAMSRADKFDVELIVKIKAARKGAKSGQIPVAIMAGCPRERVEEMLRKAISQEWFLEQLRGIVGEPAEETLEEGSN